MALAKVVPAKAGLVKAGKCATCGRRGADSTWGDSRLALMLRLMAILPTTASAGLTFAEIMHELSASKSTLFRLMRALRLAELEVESCFSPSGVKVYHLPKQRQALIGKLLR